MMKANPTQSEVTPLMPPPVVTSAPAKCTVCGDPQAPNSGEGLCWVCRRLKISAWRDSDLQPSGQQE